MGEHAVGCDIGMYKNKERWKARPSAQGFQQPGYIYVVHWQQHKNVKVMVQCCPFITSEESVYVQEDGYLVVLPADMP